MDGFIPVQDVMLHIQNLDPENMYSGLKAQTTMVIWNEAGTYLTIIINRHV